VLDQRNGSDRPSSESLRVPEQLARMREVLRMSLEVLSKPMSDVSGRAKRRSPKTKKKGKA